MLLYLIFLQIDVLDDYEKDFDCAVKEAIEILVFTFVRWHVTSKYLLYYRDKISLEYKIIEAIVKVFLLSQNSVKFVRIVVSDKTTDYFQCGLDLSSIFNLCFAALLLYCVDGRIYKANFQTVFQVEFVCVSRHETCTE